MSDDVQTREKSNDEVFCSSCGAIIKKEAEICVKCGVRQRSAKSKWMPLFLLSLFLGCFGVDRYFVGKVSTGTVKLIIGFLAFVGMFTVMSIDSQVMSGNMVITDQNAYNTLNIIYGILATVMTIWWLFDFIMICCGKFTDSKGNVIKKD